MKSGLQQFALDPKETFQGVNFHLDVGLGSELSCPLGALNKLVVPVGPGTTKTFAGKKENWTVIQTVKFTINQ